MLGLHFTPACVLLSVCSLHFTLSLHFTPGPQSAVHSLQSAFYTDQKNKGPGKQVLIIEVQIIKLRLYNESSLTKCNRHSRKWTALLTATFTKPHFNSHTNSVFFNPHKRLQMFLGFTSSIFAL